MTTTVPALSAELSLRGFVALLRPKKAMPPRAHRIAFEVDDEVFTLDFGADEMLRTGDDGSAVLRVRTNATTLADMLFGAFDPAAPRDDHQFEYAGDESLFATMARALTEGQGWMSTRIAETKKKRGRR